MNENFVPYGVYEEIINLLGKWKVLDIKSLSEFSSYKVKYFNLLKKVRQLEISGLIKGVSMGGKEKYIYLTNKGLQYTGHDHTYEISESNLTHDIIVGRVLKQLLKMDQFIDGKMFHQVADFDVFPDALISGVKNDSTYKLALEIELTQKSEPRVKEKYRRYGRNTVFNYALFITNKWTLYNTYKRFLLEMNQETQAAIILLFDQNLNMKGMNTDNNKCTYLGKETSFSDLFSEKKS